MKKAPYTAFGKTRILPVVVRYQRKEVDIPWESTLWIERDEDWYALRDDVPTRIIKRSEWLLANTLNDD